MPFGQRARRKAGRHTRWPLRLVGRDRDSSLPYPFNDSSLRAAWTRSLKKDGSGGSVTDTEAIASWSDYKGSYNCTTANGTLVGAAVGASAICANPNNSGTVNTGSITLPSDLECTVAVLAQAPATQISARDYDALIAFSDMSVTGKWLHFGVRRLASPTSLWIGFSASNAGAGYSSWIASTTQVTPLGTSALVGWYRWIWVLSGGATLKMYLNGVDQAFTKDVDTGGPSEGQFLATTACNCITLMGRRRSSGYDEQWGAGKYDEAYWFSRPFSAGEVATLDAYLVTKLTEITG